MRHYTIIVPSDIADSTVTDDIAGFLNEFGITFIGGKATNGRFIISFKANLSRTKTEMLNTLIKHAADKLNKPEWYVSLASTGANFDFEDYQNTPLDGPEIEGEIQEKLIGFSELINNTLRNTTTEYRRQARMEIGRLIKDNVDTWINQDIELSA